MNLILVHDSPTWPSTAPVFVKVSDTVLPSVTDAAAVVNSILAEIVKQKSMFILTMMLSIKLFESYARLPRLRF